MVKKFIIFILMTFFSINISFAADNFNEYLKTVKNVAYKNWEAPAYKTKYESDINFKIRRDGSIFDIVQVNSSGLSKLDSSIYAAVSGINNLEALPACYTSDYIDLTLSFINPVNKYIKKASYTKKRKRVYKTTVIPVSPKTVKVKKVIYSESFDCASNYQDKMKNLILNLDIQKALNP